MVNGNIYFIYFSIVRHLTPTGIIPIPMEMCFSFSFLFPRQFHGNPIPMGIPLSRTSWTTVFVSYAWLMILWGFDEAGSSSQTRANEHKQLDLLSYNISQQNSKDLDLVSLYFTEMYLVRWPQAHRCSYSQPWETERWRIWRVVDCADNTERLLLQQVQGLDTDHTTCSSTRSVLMWED